MLRLRPLPLLFSTKDTGKPHIQNKRIKDKGKKRSMSKSWLSFSSSSSPEEIWQAAFADLCQRMSLCFGRRETRQHAQTYLQGLLSSTERKNGWQLAEEAGEQTPYAMQYLLDRASWESDDLRDCLHRYPTGCAMRHVPQRG